MRAGFRRPGYLSSGRGIPERSTDSWVTVQARRIAPGSRLPERFDESHLITVGRYVPSPARSISPSLTTDQSVFHEGGRDHDAAGWKVERADMLCPLNQLCRRLTTELLRIICHQHQTNADEVGELEIVEPSDDQVGSRFAGRLHRAQRRLAVCAEERVRRTVIAEHGNDCLPRGLDIAVVVPDQRGIQCAAVARHRIEKAA